ncbi:MAG: protein arginine kinase [Bacillota bacterium]
MLPENIFQNAKWMEGSGPNGDIVISSRVRLARNIEGVPFPHLLSDEQAKVVVDKVDAVINDQDIQQTTGLLQLLRLSELSALDKQILVEKHLISPQHAEPDGYKAVVLGPDAVISIMVNEEDHLRIQCLLPALQLHETWRLAEAIDDALENKLDLAFDEDYGYLTACPTNVGTGIRASVMLHLPALVMTKQVGKVLTALPQVGLVVRGLYGEGTEAVGNLFQISNQITLGQNEEEIINNLSAVTKQIIDQERAARELLQEQTGLQLADKVNRAYGTLAYARIISSQEALIALSQVRLGLDTKIIKGVEPRILNQLMVMIQPAGLQKMVGREMEPFERDVQRANVIRQYLIDNTRDHGGV